MPLMTTKPMFDLAYAGGFAVGAFNVNNMELAQSIIDACAKEKAPLILQISKGARKYANIRYLKADHRCGGRGTSGTADRHPLRSWRHARSDPDLRQRRLHQRHDRRQPSSVRRERQADR